MKTPIFRKTRLSAESIPVQYKFKLKRPDFFIRASTSNLSGVADQW